MHEEVRRQDQDDTRLFEAKILSKRGQDFPKIDVKRLEARLPSRETT